MAYHLSFEKTIKARLSKLSIFEIFCLASVFFIFVFIVKYFSIKREWRTIRIEVIGRNWVENYAPYGYHTPFWLSDKLQVGQIERNSSGRIIAKLVGLEKYVRGSEEDEAYLNVEVEVIYQKKQNKYLFKNKSLDLGSAIELNLNNILIAGQIIDNDYPQKGYPTKTVNITLHGYNVEPWIIASTTTGSKVYNLANNQPIAEITNIAVKPASGSIVTIAGDKTMTVDNTHRQKDLIISLKSQIYQQDNRWYFAGRQNILVGNMVNIYTPKVGLQYFVVENVQDL